MIPDAAHRAVRQGSHSPGIAGIAAVTAIPAMLRARCTLPHVPTVAKPPRFPLNRVTASQSIAVTALEKSEPRLIS
jgi:hypothetical protein